MMFAFIFFRFHPCLALIIADTPEANDVCGIFNNYLSTHPCRVCNFEFGQPARNYLARDPEDCIKKAIAGANDLLSSAFGSDDSVGNGFLI